MVPGDEGKVTSNSNIVGLNDRRTLNPEFLKNESETRWRCSFNNFHTEGVDSKDFQPITHRTLPPALAPTELAMASSPRHRSCSQNTPRVQLYIDSSPSISLQSAIRERSSQSAMRVTESMGLTDTPMLLSAFNLHNPSSNPSLES